MCSSPPCWAKSSFSNAEIAQATDPKLSATPKASTKTDKQPQQAAKIKTTGQPQQAMKIKTADQTTQPQQAMKIKDRRPAEAGHDHRAGVAFERKDRPAEAGSAER